MKKGITDHKNYKTYWMLTKPLYVFFKAGSLLPISDSSTSGDASLKQKLNDIISI